MLYFSARPFWMLKLVLAIRCYGQFTSLDLGLIHVASGRTRPGPGSSGRTAPAGILDLGLILTI